LRLVIKSFNIQVISLFVTKKIIPLTKILNVKILENIVLPSKKKKITINKSPHIFSKSKEQFELFEFSRIFLLPTSKNSKLNLINFEKVLKENIPVGLSIKFEK